MALLYKYKILFHTFSNIHANLQISLDPNFFRLGEAEDTEDEGLRGRRPQNSQCYPLLCLSQSSLTTWDLHSLNMVVLTEILKPPPLAGVEVVFVDMTRTRFTIPMLVWLYIMFIYILLFDFHFRLFVCN